MAPRTEHSASRSATRQPRTPRGGVTVTRSRLPPPPPPKPDTPLSEREQRSGFASLFLALSPPIQEGTAAAPTPHTPPPPPAAGRELAEGGATTAAQPLTEA